MEMYPLSDMHNPNSHPEEFWCKTPKSGIEPLELLMAARMDLLHRHPFFGKLAMNLTFVESTHLKTNSVTARGILFYNREWINHMTLEDCVWSLAHEVMHLYQRYFDRIPVGGNQGLFNLAADFVLECQLLDTGLKQGKHSKCKTTPEIKRKVEELGSTIPKVYRWLLEEQSDEQKGECQACKEEQENLKDEADNEEKEKQKENKELNKDKNDDDSDDGEGDEDSPEGGDSAAPGGDGDEEGDGHSHGEGTPHTCAHNGEMCCSGKMSDTSELDPIEEQEWTEKLIQAKMHAESKGNMPGALAEAIDTLTESKVHWTDHLKSAATRLFGHPRYTWKKPGRRGPGIGMRMPGKQPDGKTAIGGIDTSASMSPDEVRQCVSEFSEIMKICGCTKLWLILHDTDVYFSGWVEEADLTNLRMHRGGTSHRGVFQCLNKTHSNEEFNVPQDEEVTLAVLFTDLGTDFPAVTPDFDVLWGVPSDGCPGMQMEVPFGKKIEVAMENADG